VVIAPAARVVPAAPPAPVRDSLTLVEIFLFALVLIPAKLVFKPLGAAGTPAAIIALAGLAIWFGNWLSPYSGVPRSRHQPIRYAIAIWAAAVIVSYLAAGLGFVPPSELGSADRGLIALGAWSGIALMVADGFSDPDRLNALMRRITLAMSVLAGIGMLQFFTGFDITPLLKIPGLSVNEPLALINERSSFRRVAGTAGHPIEFGVVLAMAFPIALHVAFTAPKGRGFWRWLGAGMIGVAIPMSLSRSAILGLLAAALVLLPTWPRQRLLRTLMILPVLLVGMRFAIPWLLGTIKSLFTGIASDPSIQGRTDDYAVIGRFIADSPVIGRGFGTFNPADYVLLDNQYLGVLIEMGGFGLFALILLFLVGVFTARGARRRSSRDDTRELSQCLAASVIVAMVGFVTFDAFAFPMATSMTFLMIGCAGAAWRISVDAEAGDGR
jgi:O-antigen ligase